MRPQDAIQELQTVVEHYQKGILTVSGAALRIYELAAFIEPDQLVAVLPDSLRREIAEIALRPLMRREDWRTIEGVTEWPGRKEAYKLEKNAREDRQYEGMCKLHKYFTEHGKPVA